MKVFKLSFMHLILGLYGLLTVIPLGWIFLSAFKTNTEIIVSPLGFPTSFQFNNFVDTWIKANVGQYFINSLFISVVSTLGTLLLSATAAFALSRMFYQKISKILTAFILTGLTVPAGVLLIPLYFLITKEIFGGYSLYNTYLALILPYIAFGLSFSIIVLMGFMKSLPNELFEAAVIDGTSLTKLFWQIVIPLTVPILVTIFILTYISNWNEFVMAQFYIEDTNLRTLPVGMVSFRDQFKTNYAGIAVGVIYSVIPVLIIYSVLQEKIISGLTAGGIKG